MNEDEFLAELLDGQGRPGGGRLPVTSTEVETLIEVADLLWDLGHGAPPLKSDPVAAMLGLVVDPQFALDQSGLKRARTNAKVKASELARGLAARGWEVRTPDVLRWENQSTVEVAPALIKAIAEVLGTDAERLTTTRDDERDATISEITNSSQFEHLVDRWAAIRGVSKALAASTLTSRMLATVHRGDQPDASQLLRGLDALVAAMEGGAGEPHRLC